MCTRESRKRLKLLKEIPIEIERQVDLLGDKLEDLESAIVVTPGNDDLWQEEGFLEKAQPLVDKISAKAGVTVWNGVNWYEGMDKRKDKNEVEDKFHFNDSRENQALVAKSIVEIALLNNFIQNLEANIKLAGGDSSNPIASGVMKGTVDSETQKKIGEVVRESDKLKAKHGTAPRDAGDRVEPSARMQLGQTYPPKITYKAPEPNDVSGWLTLPFDAMGHMSYVSRTAARPLRHDVHIHRDEEQAVCFKTFYQYMYEKLVGNQSTKIFQSHGSLVNRMIQGGDRNRYQIKLKDAGDRVNSDVFYHPSSAWRIDLLEDLNNEIDKIRALQGHSGPLGDLAGSRVKVTEKDAPTLFHGTTKACWRGIMTQGLKRGGLKGSGRKEVYCCIMDPRHKHVKGRSGRVPLKPWTKPQIMPYDIKDKTHLVIIDTLAAIYSGVVWSQTESFAVLGDQDVPQCCIVSIVEIWSNVEVYKGNTPQRAQALCKPVQRALQTTTPKQTARPKPSSSGSSGSAGGNSGIPDMVSQSQGQKDV